MLEMFRSIEEMLGWFFDSSFGANGFLSVDSELNIESNMYDHLALIMKRTSNEHKAISELNVARAGPGDLSKISFILRYHHGCGRRVPAVFSIRE